MITTAAERWIVLAVLAGLGAAAGSTVTDLPSWAGSLIGAAATGLVIWFLYIRDPDPDEW